MKNYRPRNQDIIFQFQDELNTKKSNLYSIIMTTVRKSEMIPINITKYSKRILLYSNVKLKMRDLTMQTIKGIKKGNTNVNDPLENNIKDNKIKIIRSKRRSYNRYFIGFFLNSLIRKVTHR